jgi:hypothetical protein
MSCLLKHLYQHTRERRTFKPLPRARVWLEELESRRLLAASPLGAVLAAPSVGPSPNFARALVQPASPGTGHPGTAGTASTPGLNAGGGAAGQPGNLNPNGPGGARTTPTTFPALPTDAVLRAPPLTPFGGQGNAASALLTSPGPFFGGPAQGLLPAGLGPVVAAPNYYTGAPQYFDPNSHRLLFVGGGPDPRTTEDHRDGSEDGAVLPGPTAPRRSLPARPPPGPAPNAPDAPVAAEPAVGLAWPLLSAVFFSEQTTAEEALPAAVDLTSSGLGAQDTSARPDKEDTASQAGLLPALAALGLLGSPARAKDERPGPGLRR